MTLVDDSNQRIEVRLSSEEAQHIRSGEYWATAISKDKGAPFTLHVAAIAPVADPLTGMNRAEFLLPESSSDFKPGQLLSVQLYTGNYSHIPSKGIRHDESGDYVFTVEMGAARRRSLSGVCQGQAVIVMGPAGLRDGDQVVAISLDSES